MIDLSADYRTCRHNWGQIASRLSRCEKCGVHKVHMVDIIQQLRLYHRQKEYLVKWACEILKGRIDEINMRGMQ